MAKITLVRDDRYTAAELASMQLPGLPQTLQGIHRRAAAERWVSHQSRGRGGRGGVTLTYSVPAYVYALIQRRNDPDSARQFSGPDTLPPPKNRGGRKKERPLSVAVGERLREIRGSRTPAEFADLCDVTESELLSMEQGDIMPPAWMVMQLHTFAGVNPAFLLAGARPAFVDQGPSRLRDRRPSTRDATGIFAMLAEVGQGIFTEAGMNSALSLEDRTDVLLLAFGLLEVAGLCRSTEAVQRLGTAELRKTIRLAAELHRIRKTVPTTPEEPAPVTRTGKRP